MFFLCGKEFYYYLCIQIGMLYHVIHGKNQILLITLNHTINYGKSSNFGRDYASSFS